MPLCALFFLTPVLIWIGLNTHRPSILSSHGIFRKDFDDAAAKRSSCCSVSVLKRILWHLLPLTIGGYFSVLPIVLHDSNSNTTLATVSLVVWIAYACSALGVCGFTDYTLFTAMDISADAATVKTTVVDTYCFALRGTLLEYDESRMDKWKHISKISQLRTNFNLIVDRAIRYKPVTFTVVEYCVVSCSAIALYMIFTAPSASNSGVQTGQVITGIVITFYTLGSMLNFSKNSVTLSHRWEVCQREHLFSPNVVHKALELGFCRSLVDFDQYLAHHHDVRGIFLNMYVDHHTVSKIAKVISSAAFISIGYGVRSLFV